jgi:quercetin dioxygenase-like cupin family protein
VRFLANFPLHGGNGLKDSAFVLVELAPGKSLGEHTDSPEEVLLVLDGEVELRIGSARVHACRGMMAVVPPMVPHSIRNVGHVHARIVGFFPSSTVVSTFIETIQPLGERVVVVGDRAYRERIPEFRSSRPIAAP